MIGGVLGAVPLAALSHGHQQVAVGQERQPRPEMAPAARGAVHGEDAAQRDQAVAGQLGAGDRGAQAAPELFRVGEVEQPVVREAGVQHQVQQPALADRGDRRQPVDRVAAAVRPDAQQPPPPFGDQQVAAGEERYRPRMLQPGDHGDDLEPVLA